MHITRQCHTVKRKSARSDIFLLVGTLLTGLLNVNGRPGRGVQAISGPPMLKTDNKSHGVYYAAAPVHV